jgi:hypothetical protein
MKFQPENQNGIMENAALSKHTVSFGLALAGASVANGLLVVAKEKSPAVLSGMQKISGHHWVTHSAIILGIFFLGGWLLAKANGGQGIQMTVSRLIFTLVSGVAAGAVIIWGFYLIGD